MTENVTWRAERRKLSDLMPWPRNPRQIKSKESERLVESFTEFGQVETLAIGPDNELYNGHQRLKVLASRFGKHYEVDVRVADRALTEKEREKLTIYLHKGATGEFDFDILANEFELDELLEWGFGEAELGLDTTPEGAGTDTEPQIDKADELREKWGVSLNQMWQLGEHRLICGDSTGADVVQRILQGDKPLLMVTDPPYGVEYDPHWRDDVVGEFGQRAARGNAAENDHIVDWTAAYSLFTGDVAYVWHAGKYSGDVQLHLMNCNFVIRSHIIWAKQHFALSRGDYHWQHEPCWYAVRKGKPSRWCGDRTQSTLWQIASLNPAGRQEERMAHGTQKPIECMERPIRNHGDKGDIVYEPFSGSGTTIIACENLGRKCRAVEISPAYVAVAIERFCQHTNIEPVLLD